MTDSRLVTREDALRDPTWLAGKIENVLTMELGGRVLSLSLEDRARRWALSILSGFDALSATPAASAGVDAAWPGVEQGFSRQYRLGHHSGWNAAVAALSRSTPTPDAHAEGWPDSCPTCRRAFSTPTPDATDAAHPENRVSYWKALWETAMSTIDRLERQAAIRPDATDAGSREALRVRQVLVKAKAALSLRHDDAEIAAYDAIAAYLAAPSTPTTEGLDAACHEYAVANGQDCNHDGDQWDCRDMAAQLREYARLGERP